MSSQPTPRFAGRTVLVTGSGRGIGARTARRFAAEGARVAVVDVDLEAARRVAGELDGAVAAHVDVSSRDSARAMVAEVADALGGVDILVNNAATAGDTPFLEVGADEVLRDIGVGLLGPFFVTQAVLPGMIARGGGVVLNLSSTNGFAYYGNDAYSAAKAGVMSLTKSIATQFGPQGIRCNAVAPATIRTEYWEARAAVDPAIFDKLARRYPLGRVGTPDDVADALLFLASADASWISGITLTVDGGILAGDLAIALEAQARS
jgi:meso-butanediol dehydrogenase / (S,S)-butanediol dehydrogenase / diacetyl reductase